MTSLASAGSRSTIELVPYESDYPRGFEDTRRRVPDTSRAAAVLGFTAQIGLQEGMRRTVAWCREHYLATGRSS